jgi:hypothetical protein
MRDFGVVLCQVRCHNVITALARRGPQYVNVRHPVESLNDCMEPSPSMIEPHISTASHA